MAFREAPDLHTAAHEAVRVVQQRDGVRLRGGVGEAGDAYERHADAVADAVVVPDDTKPADAKVGQKGEVIEQTKFAAVEGVWNKGPRPGAAS